MTFVNCWSGYALVKAYGMRRANEVPTRPWLCSCFHSAGYRMEQEPSVENFIGHSLFSSQPIQLNLSLYMTNNQNGLIKC